MRRLIPLVLLVPLVAGWLAATAAEAPDATATVPATDPAQRLSAATRQLLASVTTTAYAHRTAIDESSGSYVTDCSGLLTWLLRRELPRHLAAIPIVHGRARPLAADYQEAFAKPVPGWQRIDQVQEVRAGDVIAWRLAEIRPGKSTGHVVIADSTATAQGDGVFALVVIDSTTTPHDDDTRPGTDGVGRGTIRLRVDGRGTLEAVQAREQAPFRRYAFAIARPVAP